MHGRRVFRWSWHSAPNWQRPVTYQGTGDLYSVNVSGHWEWWDFYQNGIYTGSSVQQFVIDAIEVSYYPRMKTIIQ